MLDGLKLLLDAKREIKQCNLGWRIVAKQILSDTDFKAYMKETDQDATIIFSDLIKRAGRKTEIFQMLTTLRAVRDGKQIEKSKLAELLEKVDIDAYGLATVFLKDEITSDTQQLTNPGIRKIPITATTIQSSKGLDADYVFITHFDDKYFIKDKSKISDQEICNFLVALTRARRKGFLISSDTTNRPVFVKWIDKKCISDG